jgi:branched-chain amino acid transport system substrate-binding protein
MRRLWFLVGVVVMLAAGCSPATDRALVVGAIYPVSGRQGPGGVDEANGARIAVELANSRGGVHSRPVRLQLIDVDAGGGAAAAVDRLRGDGVELVLGSYGSTISAPAAVAARRAGMLFWETGAVGEVPPEAGAGETFFRMAPMGGGLGRAAVAFVRDQLGPLLGAEAPLRYAVAYVDDAYGRSVGQGAIDEIAGTGLTLAGTFPYRAQALDAASLVRSIAAVDPDVLFVSAYFDDGVAIRRATVSEGLPLRASIGTSSSYCMPAFAATLGPAAVGLFASDKPDAAQVREEALDTDARTALSWARSRFHRRHGEEMSAAALSGFANTWALLGHVLPASPSARAGDAAVTARSIKLPAGRLPNGAGLDLRAPSDPAAGENRAAVSVIWQWVDAQTQAIVWPPAFATRPLEAIPILP